MNIYKLIYYFQMKIKLFDMGNTIALLACSITLVEAQIGIIRESSYVKIKHIMSDEEIKNRLLSMDVKINETKTSDYTIESIYWINITCTRKKLEFIRQLTFIDRITILHE